MRRLFVLLLAGISLACASPPPTVPRVEYAGCNAVLMPGPACRLGRSRELRLWVGAPPGARIEIRAAERKIDTRPEKVQNGRRFSLHVPPGAKSVDVSIETDAGQASWSLSLTRQEKGRDVLGETIEAFHLVDGLIRKLKLIQARQAWQEIELPPNAPAELRSQRQYYLGLLAEKEGDYRTALAEVQNAVEIAERVKADDYQRGAEQKLALLLRAVGRSRDSAALFDRLRRTPHAPDPCEESRLLGNQAWAALLAREAGESFGDPTPLLETALTVYGECKDAEQDRKVNILSNLALAHLQADRLRQAKDVLARAREIEPHPPLPQELWQFDLEARIALREQRPAEALRLFANLEALASGSPDGRLRAAYGQAQAQAALGDLAAALGILRRSESLLDEQSLQVPLHEGRETFLATRQALVSFHVELLLDQGRNAEALDVARQARSRIVRQLERSDRLASLPPERRTEWERLLSIYQERRSALETRAEDDWRLPADRLRSEQAARRVESEAAKRFLDQAFLVLGTPEARRDERPRPPRPGELTLAYYPLRHGRWVGFAADVRTVLARRFDLPADLPDQDELARRVLLPFRVQIREAGRLRVLASGPLQKVDFHALPFEGDVLLAKRSVIYGLDLPAAKPVQPRGRRALLVADPRGDLPGARDEVRTVRKALESGSRPWNAEEMKDTEASAPAVRRRLATADLLHYAGHGTFSGLGGWDSSLLLAGDTRLTLGDLLALDRVPSWVVLAACDAGQSSSETSVESLGLAHAFLLAGSRAVVASTRPADDRGVPLFFADLYRQLDREPDLAEALRRAQLSWRNRDPGADWAGFRLFMP
ncbi:MAG TPA: CHAT domain-containing protein [Thermoanaerobaculia bacterium]|nr:CHAT domain-containing protein [Thermoanaerobaculia bacterium]